MSVSSATSNAPVCTSMATIFPDCRLRRGADVSLIEVISAPRMLSLAIARLFWSRKNGHTVKPPEPGSRPLLRRRETPPKALHDIRWQAPVRRWKRSRTRPPPWPTRPPGRGSQGAGGDWGQGGQCPGDSRNTRSPQDASRALHNADGFLRASAETPPQCGVPLDGVQRPPGHMWAESAAGTRRTPGRWDSTHGFPQDHPSFLPGSDSSKARRTNNIM